MEVLGAPPASNVSTIASLIKSLPNCDDSVKQLLSDHSITEECNKPIPPPKTFKLANATVEVLCLVTLLNLQSLCSDATSLEKGSYCSPSTFNPVVAGKCDSVEEHYNCLQSKVIEALNGDEALRCSTDTSVKNLAQIVLDTTIALESKIAGAIDDESDDKKTDEITLKSSESKNETIKPDEKTSDIKIVENNSTEANESKSSVKAKPKETEPTLPEMLDGLSPPTEESIKKETVIDSLPKKTDDISSSSDRENKVEEETSFSNGSDATGSSSISDNVKQDKPDPKIDEAVDPAFTEPDDEDDSYEDAALYKKDNIETNNLALEEPSAQEEPSLEKSVMRGPDVSPASTSFFSYFILLAIVTIVAYLVFHNKKKILGLILEGRRQQGDRRRSGGKEYRKLDSNLEDTMESGKMASMRDVIY